MESESDLILIARAIDEKVKYMESKLEKPYLIGFNHNNAPVQEAEKILSNLIKEMDEMIEEQQEIDKFLDEENKELETSNEEYMKFLTDSQSQLEEFEKYACSNVPGYKKFVPPPLPTLEDDYVITDPSELPIDMDIVVKENCKTTAPEEIPDIHPDTDDIDIEDVSNEGELFENESHIDLVPDESQIDLVSSPIVQDSVKHVAKKLDFDQLTISKVHPVACSTEKKNKTPGDVVQKKRTKHQVDDIENLSGIHDIGSSREQPTPSCHPTKSSRQILSERHMTANIDQSDNGKHRGVTNDSSKQKRDVQPSQGNKDFSSKYFPPSLSNKDFISSKDFLSTYRRDTLGGKDELPSDRRDTVTSKDPFPRRDTIGGKKDFPAPLASYPEVLRRDTLGGKGGLPTGMRRDTLGGRKDLPTGVEGLRRDTIGKSDAYARRDTLGGRKDLPTGLRDGFSRDTFGRLSTLGGLLPTGMRDGTQRDTLTGEAISSRRLSHYRAVPKIGFGSLPSPPKEPVTSELGLKLIGRYK